MLDLSLREARRIAIGAQLLAGPTPKRPTKQRMLDVIRHLGAVQIDSISVVARSHHIVLWSRIGNHPYDWVYGLLGTERALFEYWAHAAAFVPIENFRYFRRAMLAHERDGSGAWSLPARRWLSENGHVLDQIMAHVMERGAVSAKSFAPPDG